MSNFILQNAMGEEPCSSHFSPRILSSLESLYAALLPQLSKGNCFLYLASTARGEGASTIGWALAYYVAMREDQDCLFVDGDVRHPVIAEESFMPESGVSDYLQSEIDFKLLPFNTELKHLSAIHSGRIKGSYVRLSEARANRFAQEAKNYYRLTVFNALSGFDKYCELWSGLSDAVILNTEYRSTKRQILDRMLSGFKSANIEVTGLTFNKVRFPIPDFIYRRL